MVASIEAPFALLEKPIKVLRFDAVESPHVTLGLVPEILNSIDVIFLIGEERRVIDSAVMEVAHIKSIIGSKCVRVNDAVGLYALFDDRQQGLSFGIRDDGRKNLPTPF